jgi:3D (Asp-Asp-Asp) domain-containing protein
VTFEYWRALNLKATSYSPCEGDPSVQPCLNLTYNGTTVTQGVVAMVLSWFNLFENQHLFIPGYGEAVVADVGGGWPNGNHYWVDLGWSDADYRPLTYANGVTVYFLTPVPANPGYILP